VNVVFSHSTTFDKFTSGKMANFLTHLLLGYVMLMLGNQALSCYFRAALQPHNLAVDCARELFKPSKDSARLLVCNEKKN